VVLKYVDGSPAAATATAAAAVRTDKSILIGFLTRRGVINIGLLGRARGIGIGTYILGKCTWRRVIWDFVLVWGIGY